MSFSGHNLCVQSQTVSYLSLFFFFFSLFMCPYSGAQVMASCAPRISVFVSFYQSMYFVMFVVGHLMCPYSGAHGMASCAPKISVFETILVISLKKIFKLKSNHFPIVFGKFLSGFCSGNFFFWLFFYQILFIFFHICPFFVCFWFIYVPYSGAHGTLSCAPRISVFETILILLFNNFRLGNLPFPVCFW